MFTLDLALLLKAGARLDDALELLASDTDVGGLRPIVAKVRASILSGESFGEALSHHPALFPPMYVALVRVGEASGTLGEILEVLAAERARAEALRRKLGDALRYPAFVLFAAMSVLMFFLLFVLPQFAAVLRDFNAKLDPTVLMFIGLSEFLRAHGEVLALAARGADRRGVWLMLRRPKTRAAIMSLLSRLPLIRPILDLPPHHAVLPQSRRPAGKRGAADDDTAHPGGHDGDDERSGGLDADGRARAPRRQAVGRADRYRDASHHGGAHATFGRRDGSVADARRAGRGILRGEAAAQPRPRRRHRRARRRSSPSASSSAG